MFLIPGMIAIALQNKAGSGFDMGYIMKDEHLF